jgi:hypothetical protein
MTDGITTTGLRWHHHIPAGSQHAAGGFVSTSEDRKDIDAQVICHVHFDTKYGKLIAAAPELLEALVELSDWYTEHTGLPAAAANAAIAKAMPPTPEITGWLASPVD